MGKSTWDLRYDFTDMLIRCVYLHQNLSRTELQSLNIHLESTSGIVDSAKAEDAITRYHRANCFVLLARISTIEEYRAFEETLVALRSEEKMGVVILESIELLLPENVCKYGSFEVTILSKKLVILGKNVGKTSHVWL